MAFKFKLLISLFILVPITAFAQLGSEDLPAGTRWYLHVDLEQMRESASGRELYDWLDGEVFVEIQDEIGIDVGRETDRITAFSSLNKGTIIVLEGGISKESREKVLAVAELESELDTRVHKGKTYYRIDNSAHPERHRKRDSGSNIAFGDLDDEAYFSFAIKDKLIVASSDGEMQSMLDSGGRIAGGGAHSGALFVLAADKTFVQAGLKTDDMADDDGGWQSNIVRNTEQVALLVSESKDHIAVQAQLVSADPAMAQSIGGIINGLVSLQAFNTELDPDIQTLIRNTRIEVKDKVLTISTVIDPKTVVQVLND